MPGPDTNLLSKMANYGRGGILHHLRWVITTREEYR
jgi:hypothetical protein